MASRVPQVSADDFFGPDVVTADDFADTPKAPTTFKPSARPYSGTPDEPLEQAVNPIELAIIAAMTGGAGVGPALAPKAPALAQAALTGGAGGAAFGGVEDLLQGHNPLPNLPGNVAMGAGFGMLAPVLGMAGRRVQSMKKAGKPIPAKLAERARMEIAPADPVSRVTKALQEVPDLRKEQEALYRTERGKRIRSFEKAGEKSFGEAGAKAQLGTLKGELPKVEFGSLRGLVEQGDIDQMFEIAKTTPLLGAWERPRAITTLLNLFQPEGVKLPTRGELQILEKAFGPQLVETLLKKQPQISRLKRLGLELISTPREIMSSFDLSAPLRQGLFIGAGHPKAFASAFGTMLKSITSKEATQQLEMQIARRPTFEMMNRSGLALTKAGSVLGQGEEVFRHGLASKVPGLKNIVGASERTYTNFLNKIRADTFDSMVRDAQKAGVALDDQTLRSISGFINAASGRGDLPSYFARHGESLSAVFYSPRLMASRVQLMNPSLYIRSNPVVRQHAIRSLLSLGSLASTAIGLASLAGAESDPDMTSPDWGKIKMGNTRYDILGGFQQYLRLGAQIAQGVADGDGVSGKVTGAAAPTLPFLRKKLAPVPSLVADMWTGKDYKGDDFSVPEAVMSRFTPMVLKDIGDTMQEWGWIGAPLAAPSVFGVGVSTYEE